VAKVKEKELVHWFKVAVVQDPKASGGAHAAAAMLAKLEGVTDVDYLRSSMRSVEE
jgi:hypothetical protein